MSLRIRIWTMAVTLLSIGFLPIGPATTPAQAAPHEFCRAYAQTAQKQFMLM